MMTSGSQRRRKGHDFERWLVQRFREALPGRDVHRGLQYRDGTECADVTAGEYYIEAKVGRSPQIRRAYRQACVGATPEQVPVAVVKVDREVPTVTLSLPDFLAMIRELDEHRTG